MYFDTAMYLELVRLCVLLIKSTYQWPEQLVIATRHGALGARSPDQTTQNVRQNQQVIYYLQVVLTIQYLVIGRHSDVVDLRLIHASFMRR